VVGEAFQAVAVVIFGLSDEELIENLEALRKKLCCYIGETCDCKFMSLNGQPHMTSETTGCCEIRQAIELIKGQRDEVLTQAQLFEDTALKRLHSIRQVIEKPWPTS
jgi:hypothetical protein